MCLVYIGDSDNGSPEDFDSFGGSSILSSPAKNIPLSYNGSTIDSDSMGSGSIPLSGANSESNMYIHH